MTALEARENDNVDISGGENPIKISNRAISVVALSACVATALPGLIMKQAGNGQ